jgi:plasmid stabilization system protein ParE
MSYEVRFSMGARADLARLCDHLLDRAETVEELELAERAVDAVEAAAIGHLAATPYSYRKANRSPTRRELVIPFGSTGYVALFEIATPNLVLVLAIRHQREDDYH